MKKITLSFILLTIVSLASFAQTNVSGGIYANTTWTLVNSPYIVVDTVVVFPGVTLTIEPGVVVKFDDNKLLRIRQAKLMANGTITDSITFTSNSLSPFPGIYAGINADPGYGSQVTYCNFEFATNVYGGDTIRHCKAMHNVNGLYSINLIDSCIIRYCTGMGASSGNITNCIISNNYQGAAALLNVINCIIDSSTTFGIHDSGSGVISNSKIRYDSVGIYGHHSIDNCIITHHKFGIVISSTVEITNCTIDSNYIGILNGRYYSLNYDGGANGYITNCEINYNTAGIDDSYWALDNGNNIISFCHINYNAIGIGEYAVPRNVITKNYFENDSTGIVLEDADSIYCNRFCNNISYSLKYLVANNITISNNNWCTLDSTATEAVIYDGYDNVNYGLVYFMPLDSTCSPVITSINEITQENLPFRVYPNPASDYLTLHFAGNTAQSQIRIINLLGEVKYNSPATGAETNLNISSLAGGIYFVEVAQGNKVSRERFVKQ